MSDKPTTLVTITFRLEDAQRVLDALNISDSRRYYPWLITSRRRAGEIMNMTAPRNNYGGTDYIGSIKIAEAK